MDAVEILLFGVVGLSVMVFLIIDKLDPQILKQSGDDVYDSDHMKCRIQESVEESGRDQSVGGDGGAEKKRVASEILEREEKTDNICRERGNIYYSESESIIDDWEGVERSELEKIFGEAMVYANCKSNINGNNGIGEDVKLQLYGLQKVALEGPCPHNSQPMALHLSARSKWNAWQKLGNMSAEMAMENYIAILTKTIPEWKKRNHNLQSKGEDTQLIKIRRYLRI